jgi:hypothetical protein
LEGNPLLQIEVEPTSEVRINSKEWLFFGSAENMAKPTDVFDDAEDLGHTGVHWLHDG